MAQALAHVLVLVIGISCFMQISLANRATEIEGVTETEDQRECLSRLRQVSKQRWWKSNENDPLFAPTCSSIGETCINMSKTCDEFNHWTDFRKVAKAYGTEFLVVSQKTTNAKTQTLCTHTVSGKPCIFPFIDSNGHTRTECWREAGQEQDSCATTRKDHLGSYSYNFCKCRRGRYGVHYTDIGQGQLGNCYFLAVLASVAKASPDFIHSCFHTMDANQGGWATKWYAAGKRVSVLTDDMVPADPDSKISQPFFLQLGGTGEFWPMILEKAWAKLYGSYEAVDGGLWAEAGFALTGAPHTDYVLPELDGGLEKLEQILLDATTRGFPMGAGTYKKETEQIKRIGVVTGHAYSVFKLKDNVVTVSNPWGTNGYKGDLANPGGKPLSGKFDMTLNEFFAVFKFISVLHFHGNYEPRNFPIKVGTAEAISLTMTLAKPFYVMLVWPSRRLLLTSCSKDRLNIVPMLAAMREDCVDCPVQTGGQRSRYLVTGNMWVRLEGPGNYNIFWHLGLSGESAGLFMDAAVSVYADKGERLENVMSVSPPGNVASKMLLPTDANGQICSLYWVDGHGMFSLQTNKAVNGVPRLFDQRDSFFYFDAFDNNWKITGESKWGAVSEQGERWSRAARTKEDFKCSTGAEILEQVAPLDKETGHRCQKIIVPKLGVLALNPNSIANIQVYRNKKFFAYYTATTSEWHVTTNEKWDDVSKGEGWSSVPYKKDELECFDERRAFEKFGPGYCATVFVNEHGLFTHRQEQMVTGMPTYWQTDQFMYFNFRNEQWLVASKDEYHTAKATGESATFQRKHEPSELSCKTGGQALAKLLEPSCRGGAIDALTFGHAGVFFKNPRRTLNGMSTYESPEGNIAYHNGGTSWRLVTPNHWQEVLDGGGMGYRTVDTANIVCGCKDAPVIEGFADVACNDVKPRHEKYSNLKCSGGQYPGLIKTYCPETCKICPDE